MSAWHAIKTDWVRDLLGLWASQDLAAEKVALGHATVSPMFRRAVGAPEEDGSYGSEELQAMAAGVEVLRTDRPELHAAVLDLVRGRAADPVRVAEAGRVLQDYVDRACP